jgi:hypothetical protein
MRGSSFAFVLLVPALLACGEGGGTGASVSELSADLENRYADVERCTGLTAPPPAIRYEPTEQCPNGRLCCMEAFGEFACASGICGMGGYYDPEHQAVLLPDHCFDHFRHEAIHHLLFATGRADWNDHAAGEFRCE